MTQDVDSLTVGVPQENFPGENRVGLIPAGAASLIKAGLPIVVESGAGEAAGFSDDEYIKQGAEVANRQKVFDSADILLQVRTAGAAGESANVDEYRAGQLVIATADPLGTADGMTTLAEHGVDCFAMELLPRITRAQSMDVLSSMASLAGYKAVLMAAGILPRIFPMMMTAAGTLTPARVLVLGAGVAGLQAIATARKLGGVVWAYDIRPAVKEEVLSLGAKFLEIKLDTGSDGQSGGYAQEMTEEFYEKQRQMMLSAVADSDVVITTAAVPGNKAPTLVTTEMVHAMSPGSVIVDLAAEQSGNCELTQPNEQIVENGVTICGVVNVPSTVANHASQMYSKNLTTLLLHALSDDGQLQLDSDDEIIRGTLATREGIVVHPRIREVLGLPELTAPNSDAPEAESETNSDEPTEDVDEIITSKSA